MNELQKLVAHVRNLKNQNISEATFDVEYLHSVLDTVAPSQETVNAERVRKNTQVVGDGGKFAEE